LITSALALSLLGAPATADLYFEQTTIVYVEGQAAGPGVHTRTWHAGKKIRLESGDAAGPALVLRLDLDRAWRLDPGERVAVALDTARLRARSQADAAFAAGLMGAGDRDAVRATALEESRDVAGYSCRGYRLTGPSVQMVLWVTEDLPVGVDAFADLLEWSGASRSLGGLLARIRELPGFPLETRTRVEVLDEVRETVSAVTTIEVGSQPGDLFEVPRGWRVVAETPPPAQEGEPE
jgi:hypothetical protein